MALAGSEGEGVSSLELEVEGLRKLSENLLFHLFILLSFGRLLVREGEPIYGGRRTNGEKGRKKKRDSPKKIK